jgi:hypothetical protein
MEPTPCNCQTPCKCSSGDEYLLVKATGSEAALCGPIDNQTGTESCPIQEPTYDLSHSDFLLPSEITGSFINMQVCNGSIYTVGQWLFFITGVHLKISAITGNLLSLINQCSPGVVVDTNPDIGFIVYKNTPFVVSDGPACLSDDDKLDFFQEALSEATELCAPNLVVAPLTDEIHPVGLTINGGTSHTKCIKRIPGISFKGTIPYLTTLNTKNPTAMLDYNRLVVNKLTREVALMPTYGDWAGLTDGNLYTVMVKNNEAEKLLRFNPFIIEGRSLYESSQDAGASPSNTGTWEAHTDTWQQEIVLDDPYGRLVAREDVLSLMVRIDFAAYAIANQLVTIKYDSDGQTGHAAYYNTADAGTGVFNSITTLIPVKRTGANAYKFNLEFQQGSGNTVNAYYKVFATGYHP